MSIPSDFIPMSSILTSVTAMKARQVRLEQAKQAQNFEAEDEWLQPSLPGLDEGCSDFDRNRPRVSA